MPKNIWITAKWKKKRKLSDKKNTRKNEEKLSIQGKFIHFLNILLSCMLLSNLVKILGFLE